MKSLRSMFVISCVLAAALPGFALHSRSRSTGVRMRRTRYRPIYWHPVFQGSRESLLLQNQEIDRLQLPRIADEEQLQELIEKQELLPLESNDFVTVAIAETNHRYCKAWTRDFVEDLGEAFYKQFHRPIEVTSAVRTIEYQHKLRRHNRNAAPEAGETASSHLAGITVDVLKRGMTRRQRHWLDEYLAPLKEQGLIEPEEERRQPVYHIMVSSRYSERENAGQVVEQPEQVIGVVPVQQVADK